MCLHCGHWLRAVSRVTSASSERQVNHHRLGQSALAHRAEVDRPGHQAGSRPAEIRPAIRLRNPVGNDSTSSSLTNPPRDKIEQAALPSSVPALHSARNISPVEIAGIWNRSAR
jgi:hypothetical protein